MLVYVLGTPIQAARQSWNRGLLIPAWHGFPVFSLELSKSLVSAAQPTFFRVISMADATIAFRTGEAARWGWGISRADGRRKMLFPKAALMVRQHTAGTGEELALCWRNEQPSSRRAPAKVYQSSSSARQASAPVNREQRRLFSARPLPPCRPRSIRRASSRT